MKTLLVSIFLLFIFDLNAKVVYVEPVRNAKYVSINNNIIIGFDEALASTDLNSILSVTGSLSGIHNGEIILTADKKKLIFKPNQPFEFNETVEVKLNRVKTSNSLNKSLRYSFLTQMSKLHRDYKKSIMEESGNTNYNEPQDLSDSLNLPSLTVNISNNPSPGNLFISNFPFSVIPYTPYLLIADNTGNLSYFREVNIWAIDYKRQPNGLMTYNTNGKFYEEDNQHNIVDSLECGNGYDTDHHELQILNNGHALMISYDPEPVDMSQIVPGGNPNAIVTGLILQELDENKNVVFQWRSWDHFAITDATHENLLAANIDYVHGNAIDLDNDGNLLISSRHLSEITKINRTTGEIIWRLGGVHNQFTFTNDPERFSYQHHIRRISNGNITLFDNGNYHTAPHSRAVEYKLNETTKTATLVWQYNPGIYGFAMGSVQRLRNGNTLICWGAANPTITELTPAGSIALQMDLPPGIFTYRAFRDEVNLTLNIKLATEGFYNTQTGKLNKKDTVKAYLRRINSPYNIVDSSQSVVDSVNFTGNFRYYNVSSGTYYISIKHRNGLETWSKPGGQNFASGDVSAYDFTISNSQAYGNNLIHKGSRYCIYSGDVNQDGVINAIDLSMVDNQAYNFASGYVSGDIDGNNFVDIFDLNIAEKNASNFVGRMTPP